MLLIPIPSSLLSAQKQHLDLLNSFHSDKQKESLFSAYPEGEILICSIATHLLLDQQSQ